MQVKTKSGRVIELPTEQEDSAINDGILNDADTAELAAHEFKLLRPVGRPKAEHTKERVTIRLSADVVASFRATGKGWQGRMDAALKEFIRSHTVDDIKHLDN